MIIGFKEFSKQPLIKRDINFVSSKNKGPRNLNYMIHLRLKNYLKYHILIFMNLILYRYNKISYI